jgi:hypothetical protein
MGLTTIGAGRGRGAGADAFGGFLDTLMIGGMTSSTSESPIVSVDLAGIRLARDGPAFSVPEVLGFFLATSEQATFIVLQRIHGAPTNVLSFRVQTKFADIQRSHYGKEKRELVKWQGIR